jgi:hypothetical protein
VRAWDEGMRQAAHARREHHAASQARAQAAAAVARPEHRACRGGTFGANAAISRPWGTLRVAEHFTVDGGKITRIR